MIGALALLPAALAAAPPCPATTTYRVHASYDPTQRVLDVRESVAVTNHTPEDWRALDFQLGEALPVLDGLVVSSGDRTLQHGAIDPGRAGALRVDLGVAAGASAHLELSFRVPLPKPQPFADNPVRLGEVGSVVVLGSFLPMLPPHEAGAWQTRLWSENGDQTYLPVADFDLVVETPRHWAVAATGTASQPVVLDGDRQSVAFRARGVRELGLALCSDCRSTESASASGLIRVLAGPETSTAVPMELASSALEWMTRRFGPLSHDEIDVVLVPGSSWGVEFPGFVVVADDGTNTWDYDWILAHEIAHQWFYGEVGNDQFTHPWVDEGLATWASLAWLDGRSPSQAALYRDMYRRAPGSVTDPAGRPVDTYRHDAYLAVVYGRGFDALDNLRAADPAAFDVALAHYYQEQRCGFAGLRTFVDTLVYQGGGDAASLDLYRQWVDPTWTPLPSAPAPPFASPNRPR